VLPLLAVLLVCLLLAAPVTTAVGARRRGLGTAAAVVVGIFFPVTWVVWYVRDERPFARQVPRRDGRLTPSA
jgi:ABC-type polysaccharide/polyol phosphate export permease